MQAQRAIREYSCATTYIQGSAAVLDDILALGEANPPIAPLLNELNSMLTARAVQRMSQKCSDVELTYLELQWYRLKQQFQQTE